MLIKCIRGWNEVENPYIRYDDQPFRRLFFIFSHIFFISFETLPLENSTTGFSAIIAFVTAGSKGISPAIEISSFPQKFFILLVFSKLILYLLMQTTVFTPKCFATDKILFKSWIPESVGSVTSSARSTPDMDEMTGQPIPGGPSLRMYSSPSRSARDEPERAGTEEEPRGPCGYDPGCPG